MRNRLNKQLKNEKGLTLIELLAVIVILAIVAAIAIPSVGSIIDNSKSKAILSDATQVISSAKTEITDGSCNEPDPDDGSVTCSKAVLEKLIEGATLGDNDQVVKSGTTYTIKYADLNNLNEKYKKKLFDDEDSTEIEATATELAEAMGKK